MPLADEDDDLHFHEMEASLQTLLLEPPTSKLNYLNLVGMDLVLNDVDLLTEILLRLPAKSLTRFKSVSKEWLSLISSDRFCHRHTLCRPKLEPSLMLQTDDPLFFYFNPTINGAGRMIPYSLSVPDHQILQACNGLMLLESEHIKNSCYVYNPTTKQSRKISLTYSDRSYPYLAGINLAFDPSKSPYYKIVCIWSTAESDPDLYSGHMEQIRYQIEVYDSESHNWKLCLEKPFTYHKRLFHSYGVYWNDAIYWRSGGRYYYFDIAKDEIKEMSCPETPDSEYQGVKLIIPYLQESNGHLYHFANVIEGACESVAVWELGGDYHSQWLLKYHHTLTDVGILRYMWKSDGDGTCSLLTLRPGKIRAYRFLNKSCEDLLDFTAQPFYKADGEFYLGVMQFGEVLALV